MLHDGGVDTFSKVLQRVRATTEQQMIDECTTDGRWFEHLEADQANATADYRSKEAGRESRTVFFATT